MLADPVCKLMLAAERHWDEAVVAQNLTRVLHKGINTPAALDNLNKSLSGLYSWQFSQIWPINT